MPRNTNKKTSKRSGQSSSQPTGENFQTEGYTPVFDPSYWATQQQQFQPFQTSVSPIPQTSLFQNMSAFGTQSPIPQTPPFQQFQNFQTPQSPFLQSFQHSPQFQPPLAQQFQSQQSRQSPQYRPYSPQFQSHTDSDEVVPESEPEDNYHDEHVYDNEDEDEDEDADEGGSRRSGKGKAQRKAWNHTQESLLGKAWCDVSQDARYGNDQTSKQFWLRVTKRFNTELGLGPDYRSHHQCNTKFNNMNRDIQKFNGIFTAYWNQPRSGESEMDVIDRAERTFRSDFTRPWKYAHVWKIVKDVDKWQQLPLMDEVAKRGTRRANLSTGHLRTPREEHLNVDLNEPAASRRPLPQGRDGARKKARSSGSSSNRSEELVELRNDFNNLSANLNQHMSTNAKMKAYDIYMRNISHLEGEEYETARKMKEDIKRTFGF